jgi:hypothetical protein
MSTHPVLQPTRAAPPFPNYYPASVSSCTRCSNDSADASKQLTDPGTCKGGDEVTLLVCERGSRDREGYGVVNLDVCSLHGDADEQEGRSLTRTRIR